MVKQKKSKENIHDSSNRQESNNDLVDMISGIPDDILGFILSFLPTKQVVATSILSKRWKFVWRIHNLDFYYEGFEYGDGDDDIEDMKFVRFVNRVLLLHDAELLKFSLVCANCFISSYVSEWISTAIAKNVYDLSLCGEIDLPLSVFSCDSLQSLELDGIIHAPDVFLVCLPRLESLTLSGVYFYSEEDFERVISGCPMLNYLFLHICRDDDDELTYIISSTSLRRAELYFDYKCNLQLKASSIEYLKVRGCIPEIFVQKRLSSLVEANFSIDLSEDELCQAEICDSIVEVVRAFDCARTLTLSADVMRALSCVTISLSTEFKRLMKLVAGTYYSSLHDFIQSSNNLEALTIDQLPNRLSGTNLHDHWTTPVEVPRCLSNSLKKVRIGGYKGLENEHEMIRYMLKHGSALECIQISCHSERGGEKIKLLQQINEVPRKSMVCEVQFELVDIN